MEFGGLVAGLSAKQKAVYTLEKGKPVRHSYRELADHIAQTRQRLMDWGVTRGMRVGIYAPNSYQWLVHDLALIEIGAISVPFTDDFAGAVNEALLEKYDIGLLLIGRIHERRFGQRPPHVALLDGTNGEVRARARTRPIEDDEADQLSLVFSSGSAGGLKGLVVSRQGVVATLPPIIEAIGLGSDARLMMFLPMSNFQQRNMCYAALWNDFDIVISDYTQLFAAMQALHPTVLIAPPVLYQMIHGEFGGYPAWKRFLWLTLGAAIAVLPGAGLRRAVARMLFPGFHRQFGDRMRTLVTGMAPIRRNIGTFFQRMQLPLCESYGMMEAGSITYRGPHARAAGSVGKLLRGVAVSFGEGDEVIVQREHPLTLRYFQCADGENERTFLGHGRIATGDIGRMDGRGNLYLLGRKKELLVTSSGLKVHPEVIEEELNNCPGVAHSVIFLRPDAAHLTCVVSLNQSGSDEAKAQVRKFVAAMESTRKFAQYVEILFAEEPFSTDNGMLRPNLKIDRKQVTARYSA